MGFKRMPIVSVLWCVKGSTRFCMSCVASYRQNPQRKQYCKTNMLSRTNFHFQAPIFKYKYRCALPCPCSSITVRKLDRYLATLWSESTRPPPNLQVFKVQVKIQETAHKDSCPAKWWIRSRYTKPVPLDSPGAPSAWSTKLAKKEDPKAVQNLQSTKVIKFG